MCKGHFFKFILVLVLILSISEAGTPFSLFGKKKSSEFLQSCDPNLEITSGDPLGYRLRGKRCEGRYIKEVASAFLNLVSLTSFFEEYDYNIEKDLIIDWTAPEKGDIQIRVTGTRDRLFYRMDTVVESGNSSFRWPTELLSALAIARTDIGAVGWTQNMIGGDKEIIYLPLRIRQAEAKNHSNTYRVILFPGQELTEVFISLAPLTKGGRIGTFFFDGKALGYSHYPALQQIEFEIPDINNPGIHVLEIGAMLRSGGSIETKVLFYHSD